MLRKRAMWCYIIWSYGFFTGGVQPVAPSNTPAEPLYSTVVKVKKKSGEGLPPTQLPPADQATSKIKTEEHKMGEAWERGYQYTELHT